MIIQKQPTLAASICDLRIRKIKKTFFTQINTLNDCNTIAILVNKGYSKGKRPSGRPSYDGVLLFKMCLLQSWYGWSDYEVEFGINDSLSFSYFCGMTIEQVAPHYSTLSRFRTALTKTKILEKLFTSINKQLETHNIIVKTGLIIDPSVIDTPLRPKGKTNFKLTENRCEERVEVHKEYAYSFDTDRTWLKKRGNYHFGFKKHPATDNEGLVLIVLNTTANKNEISNLAEVLETANVALPKDAPLNADKEYHSKKNLEILKNHILKKAVKNKPLTKWEARFNKLSGKTRFKIERTFGGIKLWFKGEITRYRGLKKMQIQNLMEAMCYNLYRRPGLSASNCKN